MHNPLSGLFRTVILKNRGYGCLDTPKDHRDYSRRHFFGNKIGRPVPEEYFDHGLQFPGGFNQAFSMACTYFSYFRLLQWKFWKATGKKLKLDDKFILTVWDIAVREGYGNKKKGAYIYDPLKFFKEYAQQFMTEDGEVVTIWVKDYFDLEDEELWEEVYYGGGVLTGTSSRMGLDVSHAKYRPYLPKDKRQNKNDGHAFPIMGKGYSWVTLVNRVEKTVADVEAAIHPNSYGGGWGHKGAFYSREDQRDSLFRFWGFTIGYEFENKDVKKDVDPDPSKRVEEKVPESVEEKKIFQDVGEGSWAAEAIQWGVDKGLVNGYGDEELPAIEKIFQPDKPMSRAEMIVVLKRFYHLLGKK